MSPASTWLILDRYVDANDLTAFFGEWLSESDK